MEFENDLISEKEVFIDKNKMNHFLKTLEQKSKNVNKLCKKVSRDTKRQVKYMVDTYDIMEKLT